MGLRKFLTAIMKPIGLGVYRRPKSYDPAQLRHLCLLHKRPLVEELSAQLIDGCTRGPFKGLRLPQKGAWSDADKAAKLIGAYEQELFPYIEHMIGLVPTHLVNVGASEGYYAIGIKRRVPACDVYTYDIDMKSFPALELCQRLNGVTVKKLAAFSFADPLAAFSGWCEISRLGFVIDCEGGEIDILNMPAEVVRQSAFLIEMHDLFVEDVTAKLSDFLGCTHLTRIIPQGGRDFRSFPELAGLTDLEKALVLDEYRAGEMNWLYAVPKSWDVELP